jgi:hypothetical protein
LLLSLLLSLLLRLFLADALSQAAFAGIETTVSLLLLFGWALAI